MSEGQTEASIYQQAENGKTELSLMHFTIKNPRWQPPQESSVFISHLKDKVQHDAQTGPSTQLLLSEAPLCTSLQSNESATGVRNPEDTNSVHHMWTKDNGYADRIALSIMFWQSANTF